MIVTKQLTHTFQRMDKEGTVLATISAVNGVNLTIKEGEFVAILGHNGSGKSTLARHLNALLLPHSGQVYIDNMDTSDTDLMWEIRKKVGMVFQNPDNQMVAAIIEEEVGFGPENLCLDPKEIHQRVERCLKLMGMTDYKKGTPNRLSGGQKQRVVIASVLAMNPKYLVLDEPTAMLDPKGREDVMRVLKECTCEQSATVVLVTHFMEEVILADKVIIMDHGELIAEGTPRELFSQKELIEDCRLDLPVAAKLAELLKKKGLPLPDGILTKEELVEELCGLDWKI
ncbi:MAG: energy-coupling factor transporter ATPase [Lachnospiraceae bacterium]